jgi:hypothetical protein
MGIVVQFPPVAPPRFSKAAKEQWPTLPEVLQHAIARTCAELTDEFNKTKAAAKRDREMAEFHKLAAKGGRELKDVIANYVATEKLCRDNIVAGIVAICGNVGVDPIAVFRVAMHNSDCKPGDEWHIGVMADEVEAVRPDLIHRDANGFRMVDYAGLAHSAEEYAPRAAEARDRVAAAINAGTNPTGSAA